MLGMNYSSSGNYLKTKLNKKVQSLTSRIVSHKINDEIFGVAWTTKFGLSENVTCWSQQKYFFDFVFVLIRKKRTINSLFQVICMVLPRKFVFQWRNGVTSAHRNSFSSMKSFNALHIESICLFVVLNTQRAHLTRTKHNVMAVDST